MFIKRQIANLYLCNICKLALAIYLPPHSWSTTTAPFTSPELYVSYNSPAVATFYLQGNRITPDQKQGVEVGR